MQSLDPSLQPIRHFNLRLLMAQLSDDGVDAWEFTAGLLAGLSGAGHRQLVKGARITDTRALEIEGAAQQRLGWMDCRHGAPHDD